MINYKNSTDFLNLKKCSADTILDLPYVNFENSLKKVDFINKYSKKASKNISNYKKRLLIKYKKYTNIIVLLEGEILLNNLDKTLVDCEVNTLQDNNPDTNLIELLKSKSENKMQAHLKANLNSVLLLKFKKSAIIDTPLLIVVATINDLSHYMQIVLEQNSCVKIIEKLENAGTSFINANTNINLDENSNLEYVRIEKSNKNSFIYSSISGNVNANASLKYSYADLNDSNVCCNTNINLMGELAYADINCVILSALKEQHMHFMQIEHFAKCTIGAINNHAVANDQSEIYIEGVGKINKGMAGSDSNQQTKVISLRDTATVTAKPFLFIDEFDVKAGHGVAVGQLDQQEIYYLMSRGLTKEDAQKLIIQGFLKPIADNIFIKEVGKEFKRLVEKKLNY
ncbi:MAG: SufD family Fe-S cluster assembly protein [Clostridia bacterium]|jgi:Fe-S cluster assembly protein SufD|nr:SufD family Fe-S cluster assembly protein [Clostridia bacterium]MDD4276224.1 SufD family Fe-S cluster assembly protein [Clostridia bacterium]